LTSALDEGCFTPGETARSTNWIGGWVGPRAGLNAVMKRKIHAPTGNRALVVQPRALSLYWLSYPSSNKVLAHTTVLVFHFLYKTNYTISTWTPWVQSISSWYSTI